MLARLRPPYYVCACFWVATASARRANFVLFDPTSNPQIVWGHASTHVESNPCEQVSCAESLAAPKLNDLSRGTRIDLLTQLGGPTPVSVAYAQRLLALEVKECTDLQLLPQVLLPWANEGEGVAATARFNLVTPRLCALQCTEQGKIEIFGKLFVEHVVVDMIMGGSQKQSQLVQLADIMQDALPTDTFKRTMSDLFAEVAGYIAALCAGIVILRDPSPTAVTECEVSMKLVRDVILGTNMKPPWSLISEALEESAEWQGLKKDFRRTVTSDLSIGREMQALMTDLEGADMESIKKACRKLPGWCARARIGGTIRLQEHLATAFEQAVQNLAQKEDDKKLAEARQLDELATAVMAAAFSEPPALKTRMLDILTKIRRACEDSNKSLAENKFLCLVNAFAASPNSSTWAAAAFKSDDMIGVRFVVEEHVSILRKGIAAAIDLFGYAGETPGDSTEGQDKDKASPHLMVNHVTLAVTLAHMINSPTTEDEVRYHELQYILGAWKLIEATCELASCEGLDDAPGVMKMWSGLQSHFKHLKDDFLEDTLRPTDGDYDGLRKIKGDFAPAVNQATNLLDSLASQAVSMARSKLVSDRDRLAECAGGLKNGGSWKEACIGGTWDAVLEVAAATLFHKDQKGTARWMTTLRREVLARLDELAMVCDMYEVPEPITEERGPTEDIVKRASVTLTEAKLVQFLKDRRATPMSQRTQIQEELDRMIDFHLCAEDIEGAIYEKALETLRV